MIALALATAMIVTATPATLPAVIAAAKGGETITLAAGDYPTVIVQSRRFATPVTIDARAATVAGVKISDSAGVTWRGGTVRSPIPGGKGRSGYGMGIFDSKGITVRDTLITDTVRAIVLGQSSEILISKNRMIGMTVDGLNIGSATHHITVDGNFCETMNTGAAHADCFQSWSRAGRPVSDVVITNNIARGRAQGIYFGNVPTRKPEGDPGFDRITIKNNVVDTLFPNGVVVADCRDCVIEGNKVTSMAGAKFRAKVAAVRSTGSVCGNAVRALPDSAAAKSCK